MGAVYKTLKKILATHFEKYPKCSPPDPTAPEPWGIWVGCSEYPAVQNVLNKDPVFHKIPETNNETFKYCETLLR